MAPPRVLYVLVYPSRLFAAHWSFWVPDISADGRETHVGDRIHVTGDRLNGFEYEYIRGYNVKEDDRHPNAFPIGHLAEGLLRAPDGIRREDSQIPVNALDQSLREVPAPGPSLNQVVAAQSVEGAQPAQGPPKRREVKDCQWWIRQAAARLVEDSTLQPLQQDGARGEDVLTIVARLPKH